MGSFEILLIAIGVAMDAFAVSISKGLTLSRIELRHTLLAGIWFGGFQSLMPIIGYFIGISFSEIVGSIDHWIAFALLLIIGLNMIREAIWGEEERVNNDFGWRTMLLMAIATSIDALAIGISMAFIGADIWMAAAVIGVVTFILSASGIYLGRVVGSHLGSKSGIIGGIVLIAIGIKILVEHLGA